MQKGVIKFQAPFEKLKHLAIPEEEKIYKSIILQAIIDASNNSDNNNAQKSELSAKEWLFNDSEWFTEVCHKANLEVLFVRKIAQEAINYNSYY